jgi:hypothetical protein
MKNIIILGVARAGKSTLAQMLHKDYNYSIISIDAFVSALQDAFPELEITHSNTENKFQLLPPFVFSYMKKIIYEYTLKKIHEICKKKGYLLVQAHPFRDDIELAPLEDIDGIEVYNGCQDEISRNDKALEYGKSTNKILTSGSDFHTLNDLAQGGIMTKVEIKGIKQLVEILKNREYKLIQDGR